MSRVVFLLYDEVTLLDFARTSARYFVAILGNHEGDNVRADT
jgi:hypothetical protein